MDPSGIVGGIRNKTGSNYRSGKSKYFIVEACEYKRNFRFLEPKVLVITNLEYEHVDFYKDLNHVQEAFRELALKVPEDGIIISAKDINLKPVVQDLKVPVINYENHIGLNLKLKQPGLHNRQNAAAASAVADFLEIDKETINQALSNFTGTNRRFEYKGKCNGSDVYDDYAHHPTEIIASIKGAREMYPDKELMVVFQPHTKHLSLIHISEPTRPY